MREVFSRFLPVACRALCSLGAPANVVHEDLDYHIMKLTVPCTSRVVFVGGTVEEWPLQTYNKEYKDQSLVPHSGVRRQTWRC